MVNTDFYMIPKINQKVQVIATYSQRMIVKTVDGEYFNSRIKGKNLRPVCGDWVLIESIKNDTDSSFDFGCVTDMN